MVLYIISFLTMFLHIVGDDFKVSVADVAVIPCAFFALLFASLLQSRRRPPLNPQSGDSWT